MKVLFMGAGTFSSLSFKSFLKHSKLASSVDILTNQPGSELERTAKTFNSKIFHSPLKSLNFPFNWSDYSIGIVSSFSIFIPSRIISEIPLINIHPSLLPQWRGPAPIQAALMNGQTITGVSIIDLHPKIIDSGSILLQEPYIIENSDKITYCELEEELAELGGKLAASVALNYDRYNEHKISQPDQNNPNSTLSKSYKITKSDGIISFKTDSFDQISRKVRALSHQIPIKTLDLIENKQVFLEDFILDGIKDLIEEKFPICDKRIGAVIFKLNSKFIGVRKFKIEGKSQIFSAGSFYSNYLKFKL